MKNRFSSDAPARGSDAGSPEPGASMWSPLRGPVFRAVWLAWVVSNTGTWMENACASWLMTTLTTSPLLVALMQTATSLPGPYRLERYSCDVLGVVTNKPLSGAYRGMGAPEATFGSEKTGLTPGG